MIETTSLLVYTLFINRTLQQIFQQQIHINIALIAKLILFKLKNFLLLIYLKKKLHQIINLQFMQIRILKDVSIKQLSYFIQKINYRVFFFRYNRSYLQETNCQMSATENLLIPGGIGFIGSNTIIQLFQKTQCRMIIIDDFSNCYDDVLERIKYILGQKYNPQQIEDRISFMEGNILDTKFLDKVFRHHQQISKPIQGIIHFAAKKAVGQSVFKPLQYFENNFVGTLNLFKMMQKYHTCKKFIFSSTAAVYGEKDNCVETDVKDPTNPYAESKACVQMLMGSLAKAHPDWKLISLRYFNPVGAHESGLLGDDPSNYPTNLIPCIQQVILGKRPIMKIFGRDYDTIDGTGVRDFIHISDLAKAHVKAYEKLETLPNGKAQTYNLGTGKGASVLQIIRNFEKALGKQIKHQFVARRQGDLPKLIARVDKANKELNWKAEKTISDITKDCVNFLKVRHGYQSD